MRIMTSGAVPTYTAALNQSMQVTVFSPSIGFKSQKVARHLGNLSGGLSSSLTNISNL
jgi:hypothetical protein